MCIVYLLTFSNSLLKCYIVYRLSMINDLLKSHSFEYCTLCCVQYDSLNLLSMVSGILKLMMTIDVDIYLV